MSTQLHEAYGIVRARTHAREDRVLLRNIELERAAQERRPFLGLRVFSR
jgi:hypothetical protein